MQCLESKHGPDRSQDESWKSILGESQGSHSPPWLWDGELPKWMWFTPKMPNRKASSVPEGILNETELQKCLWRLS